MTMLGLQFKTGRLAIPFWRQWGFKWSNPGGIDIMIPGLRIYGPSPRLPLGVTVHLTAGRWKSLRPYRGSVHAWIVAREIAPASTSTSNPSDPCHAS